jgi:hypothetical protein
MSTTTTVTGSALAELAARLRGRGAPLNEHWRGVDRVFQRWSSVRGLRDSLREHVRTLGPRQSSAVVGRSRETTTHFAWCLFDEPDDDFSFWLHEYKPLEDWRAGYADSVHNHRYHFCTTILRGSYVHERYDARVDRETGLITETELRHRTYCPAGWAGTLYADEFHRIPTATERTITFLVKSRPVTGWSLSYDPEVGIGHRHVPVEVRLGELAEKI